MDVFIDTQIGLPFIIEVRVWDTVFTMKQKIEKSQGIPVSRQTLYFRGKVLQDNLDVIQCQISPNSHLLLIVSPDYNPYYDQTQNSPSAVNNLGFPEMGNNDQLLHQTAQSLVPSSSNQHMVRRNNSQVVNQIEQFPPLSNSTRMMYYVEDYRPMMVGRENIQVLQTEQSPAPSERLRGTQDQPRRNQEVIYGQDSQVMVRSNNNAVKGLSSERLRGTQDQPRRNQEIIYGQDSQVMVRSNNNAVKGLSLSAVEEYFGIRDDFPPVTAESSSGDMNQELHNEQYFGSFDSVIKFLGIQDSPVMVEGESSEMPRETEQSRLPSGSIGETFYGEDQALATEHFSNIQHHWPVTTEEIIDIPDSPVRSNNNESSLASNISAELLGSQDLPSVTTFRSNTNQVTQTDNSPPSDSDVREIIDISDSPEKKRIKMNPMKHTVMVIPYQETRKIPVEVNASDNVGELRNELVKMQQRGELNLPQKGYYFICKQVVLDDHRSFRENGVAHGDTIDIWEGGYTLSGPTTTIVRP